MLPSIITNRSSAETVKQLQTTDHMAVGMMLLLWNVVLLYTTSDSSWVHRIFLGGPGWSSRCLSSVFFLISSGLYPPNLPWCHLWASSYLLWNRTLALTESGEACSSSDVLLSSFVSSWLSKWFTGVPESAAFLAYFTLPVWRIYRNKINTEGDKHVFTTR